MPHWQAEDEPSAIVCTGCGEALPTRIGSPWDGLTQGDVFHSRYEILCALGRGGMGTVHKARDLVLDETVAIKVLKPEYAADALMAERFKSDIKLARKVRHKNVCTIHDFGEHRGQLYISMEFVEGVDLKRVLREKGAPPTEQAYELAAQIAEGLQAVHEAGVIHRDLKSANIMWDAKGAVRLMDFGVAKQFGAGATITATGQVVGTPECMSPEQAQGHKFDFRCDVYSLGVVIFELFTGRVPFRGETPISTILKHLHEPPPLYGPEAKGIPDSLVPVLRKAPAKDPAERQSSARELAEELRQARLAPYQPPTMSAPLDESTTLAPTSLAAADPCRSPPASGRPVGRGGRLVALPWPRVAARCR